MHNLYLKILKKISQRFAAKQLIIDVENLPSLGTYQDKIRKDSLHQH